MIQVPVELFERLSQRYDWMKIKCVPNGSGGHDIMLRIDGTYFQQADAQRMARYWAGELGVPLDKNSPQPARTKTVGRGTAGGSA